MPARSALQSELSAYKSDFVRLESKMLNLENRIIYLESQKALRATKAPPCAEKPTPKPTAPPYNEIPEYLKEDRPWDVPILSAPECPSNIKLIRLVKTTPFNFDLRFHMRSHLRNQGGSDLGVFFLIGTSDTADKI